MTKEKRILYQKAYVELYEMIKLLSDEEREKIPEYFIEYLYNNMDTNYKFSIDTEKGLLEQDYMVEAKALIVKLYEKYFAPESEKEFWNEYHKLCFNMIEEQKKRKNNPDNIFKQDVATENQLTDLVPQKKALVEVKQGFFTKFISKIKRIFCVKYFFE